MLLSGCGTVTAEPDTPALNVFCVMVGPPPGDMIPEPGAPHSWIDNYLVAYDTECKA